MGRAVQAILCRHACRVDRLARIIAIRVSRSRCDRGCHSLGMATVMAAAIIRNRRRITILVIPGPAEALEHVIMAKRSRKICCLRITMRRSVLAVFCAYGCRIGGCAGRFTVRCRCLFASNTCCNTFRYTVLILIFEIRNCCRIPGAFASRPGEITKGPFLTLYGKVSRSLWRVNLRHRAGSFRRRIGRPVLTDKS